MRASQHHPGGPGRHHVRQPLRHPRLSLVREGTRDGNVVQAPRSDADRACPHQPGATRHPARRFLLREHVRRGRRPGALHPQHAQPAAFLRECARDGTLPSVPAQSAPRAPSVGIDHRELPGRVGPSSDRVAAALRQAQDASTGSGRGPSTGSGRGPSTGSGRGPSTGSGRGPSTGSGRCPSTSSGRSPSTSSGRSPASSTLSTFSPPFYTPPATRCSPRYRPSG